MTFNPEWIEYLGTLTTKVYTDSPVRLSYEPNGTLVRIEIWPEANYHIDMPLKKMPPVYLEDTP
jgi:hypothetical protein